MVYSWQFYARDPSSNASLPTAIRSKPGLIAWFGTFLREGSDLGRARRMRASEALPPGQFYNHRGEVVDEPTVDLRDMYDWLIENVFSNWARALSTGAFALSTAVYLSAVMTVIAYLALFQVAFAPAMLAYCLFAFMKSFGIKYWILWVINVAYWISKLAVAMLVYTLTDDVAIELVEAINYEFLESVRGYVENLARIVVLTSPAFGSTTHVFRIPLRLRSRTILHGDFSDLGHRQLLLAVIWCARERYLPSVFTRLKFALVVSMSILLMCVRLSLLTIARSTAAAARVTRRIMWLTLAVLLLPEAAVSFAITALTIVAGIAFSIPVALLSIVDRRFARFSRYRIAETVRLTSVFTALRLYRLAVEIGFLVNKYDGRGPGQRPTTRVKKRFKAWVLSAMKVVDTVSLPSFIRNGKILYDAASVNSSIDLMESLGWPSGVKATEVPEEDKINAYHSFSINFATGLRQMRLQMAEDLSAIADDVPHYVRSETYQNTENELRSLSRYFTEATYDFPDLKVDDVWLVVWPIFKHSKITPFEHIIKKWERKYALGPLWKDPDAKRDKKLSRRKFIAQIGLDSFTALWAATFRYANTMPWVSGVSPKGEALPPKKWMADKLRTVISAPLAHYIQSTPWNYGPNHNFNYADTPIKLGMPLNGFWLGRVFEDHASGATHWAGDLSDFDSTLQGPIIDLIKAIRKKGYENHKDYERVAMLIDANYDQLLNGLMAQTSTGNVFTKGQGLTTGHSSTGMDNSLGMTIIYLMAWKDITGLTAREFVHFNKLSLYGDDHIVSVMAGAPANWTFGNVQRSLARWGLTMRREDPDRGLLGLTFLSKMARRPTARDIADLNDAGVKVPAFVVFHEYDKLVGKASATPKLWERGYRVKRLKSYLDLCAHHPEVYKTLSEAIDRIQEPLAPERRVKYKTYHEILRDWYTEKTLSPREFDSEHEEFENFEVFLHYGNKDFVDHLLSLLAFVPDVLNPAIFNYGYIKYFMNLAGWRLTWPHALIAHANQAYAPRHLSALMRKSAYDFLIDGPAAYGNMSRFTLSTLLVQHWLFMALRSNPLRPSFATKIASLAKRFGDAQFLINGLVVEDIRAPVPKLYDMLVVFALSFLPQLSGIDWVLSVELPNPSKMYDRVVGTVMAQLYSRLPSNFKDIVPAVNGLALRQFERIAVQAPTGVGKSTTMIASIESRFMGHFERIVVIVPRAILAQGIPPYMDSAYGLSCSGFYYGSQDVPKVLNYTTPASLMLHPDLWSDDNLYVLDECHVKEHGMVLADAFLRSKHYRTIYTSATLPEFEAGSIDGPTVNLRIAQVWKIVDVGGGNSVANIVAQNDSVANFVYRKEMLQAFAEFINSLPPSAKTLTFVLDKVHCDQLRDLLEGTCCTLHSGSFKIDGTARHYIATSVADVGLTIPDIDYVLTADVVRRITRSRDGDSIVGFGRADPALLKQRKGRVGRTSNGYFVLFSFRIEGVEIPYVTAPTNQEVVLASIADNMPASVVAASMPDDFVQALMPSASPDDAQTLAWNIDAMAAGIPQVVAMSESGSQLKVMQTISGDFVTLSADSSTKWWDVVSREALMATRQRVRLDPAICGMWFAYALRGMGTTAARWHREQLKPLPYGDESIPNAHEQFLATYGPNAEKAPVTQFEGGIPDTLEPWLERDALQGDSADALISLERFLTATHDTMDGDLEIPTPRPFTSKLSELFHD